MLAPGQVIGRYQLVCRIGDGGMAHVWAVREHSYSSASGTSYEPRRGEDTTSSSRKLFALKIIHSRFAENPTFRTMFLDEARIVSAITHRNVARVYELAENRSTLYLSMEYVDGDSLFALIAPDRTVPVPIALRIVGDALAGLHAVHGARDETGASRNVVHRDVSPQNLLIALNGDVKLIDFGIALARDRASPTTDVGVVKGKVRYMAPEQARHDMLGPFTDVFGAGAILFRMLAGRAPYAMENEVATMRALMENAPRPALLPPDVPPRIVAILDRALAPAVAERYANAKEMQDAIEAVLAGEPRAPDVGAWVQANLSPAALDRRATIAAALGGAPLLHAADVEPPTVRQPKAQQAPAAKPDFMDVAALVARAQTGQPDDPPPVPPDAEVGPAPPFAPSPKKPASPTASTSNASATARRVAIVVIALVAVALVALLVVPRIARDRAIVAAREAGIELTIESVGVGASGVSFRGVGARPVRVPGVTATIDELYVVGLSYRGARITGLNAQLRGRRDDLAVGLALLFADFRAKNGGTADGPRHFSLVNARVTWDGPFGEGSRIEASDIGGELDSRRPGDDEVHTNIGRLAVTTASSSSGARFGPWALAFEDAPTGGRLHLMLDPPVPDGPSALVVWSPSTPTGFTVKIPRSSVSNLGIDPAMTGLPIDASSDVELKIEAKIPESGRVDGKGSLDLWRARPKGFAGPVDLHVEGAASGARGKPLELEKSSVTVGPFVATLSGTILPHDTGVRLDATFKSVPMTCERLARAEAKGLGPLAALLQSLGQSSGALRVTGSVNASGIVKYDTDDPDGTALSWIAKETCGVSIFGL